MDELFDGLMNSKDTAASVKRNLVEYFIAASSRDSNNDDVVQKMLRTAMLQLLASDDRLVVDCSFKVFNAWSRHGLRRFFDVALVEEIMEKKPCTNPGYIGYVLFKGLELAVVEGRSDDRRALGMAVETRAIAFVDSQSDIDAIVYFSSLLLDFPECVPSAGKDVSEFCAALLRALVRIGSPTNAESLRTCLNDVPRLVGGLLNSIWRTSSKEIQDGSINTVFDIIAHPFDDESHVAAASSSTSTVTLGAVVQFFPSKVMENAIRTAAGDFQIADDMLLNVVDHMIGWLWFPNIKNVDDWILLFLTSLASARRYQMLIQITDNNVEQLFNRLKMPLFRQTNYAVLEHMLESYQHSPLAFHKLVAFVPNFVRRLKDEMDPEDVKFFKSFSHLVQCLMYHHSGYPDLYEPILDAIKDHPCHAMPTTDEIVNRLNHCSWSSKKKMNPRTKNKTTMMMMMPKSQTGKVGLCNLGNTCYMNCVLQALFMCDHFRQSLMNVVDQFAETKMSELQRSFAFLLMTQRPFFEPRAFHGVATSDCNFEEGVQQDSSEFLTRLMDRLIEEERGRGRAMTEDDAAAVAPSSSLVRENFCGRLGTTFSCLTCGSKSTRSEDFHFLGLNFPENSHRASSGRPPAMAGGADASAASSSSSSSSPVFDVVNASPTPSSSSLSVNDLLRHFFDPELLERYDCDGCGRPSRGERRVSLERLPNFLILTLLRFSYDGALATPKKIMTNVVYPRVVRMPVAVRNDDGTEFDVFCLMGVVVHSGTSANSGHYYSYLRHQIATSSVVDDDDDDDLFKNDWLLFNDERVSAATYDKMATVGATLNAKDTPYMLIYKRMNVHDDVAVVTATTDVACSTLRDEVFDDNLKYLQEQEERSKAQKPKSHAAWWNPQNLPGRRNGKDDDDDDAPPKNCHGMGNSNFLNGPAPIF